MDKDRELLGVNYATANYKLHRAILFKLSQMLNLDICFRCQEKIDAVEVLSIEHKAPWRSAPDPVASFYDLNNVTFSHLDCNRNARRITRHPGEDRTCLECGKEFHVNKQHMNPKWFVYKFCSQSCGAKAQWKRGDTFIRESSNGKKEGFDP